MIKHVGIIGLGKMGLPMTRHLVAGNFNVAAFDMRAEASAAAGQNAGASADGAADCRPFRTSERGQNTSTGGSASTCATPAATTRASSDTSTRWASTFTPCTLPTESISTRSCVVPSMPCWRASSG